MEGHLPGIDHSGITLHLTLTCRKCMRAATSYKIMC